jgi:3-deoxy-D-manno-octulosonate 8-phosphate phosphatase (KDO 8-P phosphatase)
MEGRDCIEIFYSQICFFRKVFAPTAILMAGLLLHLLSATRSSVKISGWFAGTGIPVTLLEFVPMPKLSARVRARKIKLLLFDVDGVLTDGKLFIFPTPTGTQQSVLQESAKYDGEGGYGFYSRSLIEAKGFHAHDGASISLARLAGIKTGLITKRVSETVALRARDLKLEYVRQGIQDKQTAFEEIVREAGVELEEAAFVGDDVIDLPAMRAGGLAIAVKNARTEVKNEAHYVTPHAGGEGALRDAVEFILKAQGKWKRIVEAYIGQRGPTVQ